MKANSIWFNKPLLTVVLFSMLGFASSCSKDDNDGTASGTAHVMIVNSVEGSSSQDFYLDDAKVNSQAVAYKQTNGYFDVAAGNHKADFKTSGSASVNSTSNVNLQAGKYYTVYYTGTTSSSSTLTTEDDLSAPAAGMAKVRFVHLSSAAASAIDIGVTGASKLATGLAYKTASAYYTVAPATSFQVFTAGSATSSLTLNSLGLQAGKIYTVYVTGSSTANISYNVIVNN
ncbi:MAG: hypothetical protein K0S09_1969 [Sphingobacteriaceae bacterium]|jgi:hypothetical protein|nr:hypothetical protein [Sphingobacteriaceae bacterium]